MKRIAVLALAAFSVIQPLRLSAADPVPPAPPTAPPAVPPVTTPDDADAPKTGPQQLMSQESGSFEWPAVITPKPISEANITKSAMNEDWLTVKDKPDLEGGQLRLGLTNRIARTGRQSLYVEFNQLTKQNVSTQISTTLLPILPDKPYRVAIWGRMDKERPITLAQRSPYLKLRIDWFTAGTEDDSPSQTGESTWKVQPIPGPKHRKPLFTASEWTEFFANVRSPEDAAFIKFTWYWDTSSEQGTTDGVIYFDDAVLYGESGPKEDPLDNLDKDDVAVPAKDAPAPATPTPPANSQAPAAPAPPAPPAKAPAAPKDEIQAIPLR